MAELVRELTLRRNLKTHFYSRRIWSLDLSIGITVGEPLDCHAPRLRNKSQGKSGKTEGNLFGDNRSFQTTKTDNLPVKRNDLWPFFIPREYNKCSFPLGVMFVSTWSPSSARLPSVIVICSAIKAFYPTPVSVRRSAQIGDRVWTLVNKICFLHTRCLPVLTWLKSNFEEICLLLESACGPHALRVTFGQQSNSVAGHW